MSTSAVSAAQAGSTPPALDQVVPDLAGLSVSTPLAPSVPSQAGNGRRRTSTATTPAVSPPPRKPAATPIDLAQTEGTRLRAVERRFLIAIQTVVFGGVLMLTVGAGMLSWSHLTHIASTNGHIAPPALLFVFPTIVDGFMVMGSAVVMRHAIADRIGGRTWYAGVLVAATATLSICLNIQDSTGREVVPAWVLPGIAPALYMLGTELGLTELRLLMRQLRVRIREVTPVPLLPPEPSTPSKRDIVIEALRTTRGNVKAALKLLADRGVTVDRSYVYEIKREATVARTGR
jgi:Protein of unknown function (DUF2637)